MIKIIIVVIVTYLFSRDINVMLIGFNKKYRENTKLAIKRAETCNKMSRNYWFNYHSLVERVLYYMMGKYPERILKMQRRTGYTFEYLISCDYFKLKYHEDKMDDPTSRKDFTIMRIEKRLGHKLDEVDF
jgi:hypothetical protein|nr:MAG TPA: hypothetical protein [Caudoviricetes sp.]